MTAYSECHHVEIMKVSRKGFPTNSNPEYILKMTKKLLNRSNFCYILTFTFSEKIQLFKSSTTTSNWAYITKAIENFCCCVIFLELLYDIVMFYLKVQILKFLKIIQNI